MSGALSSALTVNLGALVGNWRKLDTMVGEGCEAAAVVKGDGYGCGAVAVGQALARAGVRTFFVAVPSEGAVLRAAIGAGPAIYILGGYGRAEAALYRDHDLRPVLNSAEQYRDWFAGPGGAAALQLDTGMNRLGMEADELASLGTVSPNIDLVMSHMGCADAPGHPVTAQQLTAFREMTAGMACRKSLSATAGTLLGPEFHFDMVRIGIGLYGGWPFEDAERVVTVEAPVIQIRDLSVGESVGYGATWVAERPSRIATISAGYADGLIRYLSHGAKAFIAGQVVPFAGRVSMDLITLDVTDVNCAPGDMVEILGPHQSIDDLAKDAGTIGHEVLTSLGARYQRRYLEA
ncbi:MAG: alanine racemase [Pseudomonadota bacterium]